MGVTWMLAMMLLWPYIFVNPIGNLFQAIQVLSRYPWNGPVLLNGVVYPATNLPWYYASEWIVIGSPPALVPLALLGMGLAVAAWLRGWRRDRQVDARLAAVLLVALAPLAAIIVLRSVLYDTLRQFLFVFPPLILLAAYGLVRGVTALYRRRQLASRVAAVGLAVLTLGSYMLVVADMIALSPYEYIYFSPVVGGLAGARGNFPLDYWATCGRASAEWLSEHYQEYTSNPAPTVSGPTSDPGLIRPFLPPSFRAARNPDFYIGFTRGANAESYPTYTVIHTVAAQGVPLCVIKVSPGTARP